MKSIIIGITILLTFNICSCERKKESKSFQVFNEGVSLSLNSIEEQNRGDFEKASILNKKSIEKFKETLRIDSAHPVVRSALGHSLYIDKQFQEAIHWFDQANKVNQHAAMNYREMGLCKINLGQISLGKSDIDKAFSMDTTKEIRELTVQDMSDIGELAFSYGDVYEQEGDSMKGKDYKTFAVAVLILAFEYDNSKKNIGIKIAEYAEKLGDKETTSKYKTLASQ